MPFGVKSHRDVKGTSYSGFLTILVTNAFRREVPSGHHDRLLRREYPCWSPMPFGVKSHRDSWCLKLRLLGQ